MIYILYSYRIHSNLLNQLTWEEMMKTVWLETFLIEISRMSAQKEREVTISNR